MKLLALIFATCFSIASDAAVWNLHGFRDNYLQTTLEYGSESGGYFHRISLTWDWTWDILYPEFADSGLKEWVYGITVVERDWTFINGQWKEFDVLEYRDSWSFWMDNDSVLSFSSICGSAPDYNGCNSFVLIIPGEYWIDFADDGTVRISTAQPSDFGKWAWDGSINPSWVEQLACRHLAKGHKK